MNSVAKSLSLQFNKYHTTMHVSRKLAALVEKVVRQDELAHHFELLHEIATHAGPARLGHYRVVIYYYEHPDSKAKQSSHLYDLQMMLDLRDKWEKHVEGTTQSLMRGLVYGSNKK